MLRREVDGQGLTARVRLTPMGNQLPGAGRRLAASKPLAEAAPWHPPALATAVRPPTPLMVLGTSSGAGKSPMTAALCRVLKRRGEQPPPFKGEHEQ